MFLCGRPTQTTEWKEGGRFGRRTLSEFRTCEDNSYVVVFEAVPEMPTNHETTQEGLSRQKTKHVHVLKVPKSDGNYEGTIYGFEERIKR